jgi:protein O-mannosyl-transferase
VSRWSYLCTQFNVIVIYVRLLFLPFGQNLDYMYPFKNGFFDGLTPLAFLFVAGIMFLGIWNLKKRSLVAFGIFWFFITLSIESSIIPIRDAMFEHRLYLPMFGFSLIIAYLGYLLLPIKRFWRILVLTILISVLGTMTYLRNEVYEKRVTIWADVVAKSPQNYRAFYNLGNALRDENRLDEAIQSYTQALTVKPNFAFAHDNLGVALLNKEMVDDAIHHFYKALEKRPYDAMIRCNLGSALMQKGKVDAAIKEFVIALKSDPNLVEARNNLGIALAQQGKLKEAIQNFEKALRIEPENPEIHSNLGFALLLQGKPQESLGHLLEAVRLNPNYAEAHTRVGSALTRLGEYDEAIQHFLKALQINPRLEQAKLGLRRAIALGKRKKFQ